MNININSIHFKADKDLETFITEKIQKIGKHYDGIIMSNVTLKLDNTDKAENKIAEIRLKIKGNELIANKQCKTFEEATEQALEALRKQLKKTKDKTIDPKRKDELSSDLFTNE